jgi:formate hydrogenlyase transcriptional activator
MVRENKFRADLYYRVNVFPILLPPLRDRKDDIRLLVEHFVARFAERYRKAIPELPEGLLRAMQVYDWQGNVRELRNFIERFVVIASASAWQALAEDLRQRDFTCGFAQTLVDTEKAHFITILREARLVVGGRNGAAAWLGLPRTTLISRCGSWGLRSIGARSNRGSSNQRAACASAGGGRSPYFSPIDLDSESAAP